MTGGFADVVPLERVLNDNSGAISEDGVPYAASASALQNLPVVGKELAAKINSEGFAGTVRVIIYLASQPQERVTKTVKAKFTPELKAVKSQIKTLKHQSSEMRDPLAAVDALNYNSKVMAPSFDDVKKMRDLLLEFEDVSLRLKNDLAVALRLEVAPIQRKVSAAIVALGGEVEFTTIAVNAMVAKLSPNAIKKIALLPEVRRIVADQRHDLQLDIADDATMVSASISGSLWSDGYDGGLFDPAVLDTGADLAHPALVDDTWRTNFYSYHLSAAVNDPDWDDTVSIDDLQGHGTHVLGIVASHGSNDYPDNLGMAPGVAKTVTLKAGFLTKDGKGSMWNSDAMYLVDRALYQTILLHPGDTFKDDIDGINLSFGGAVDADETSYSRFWDSVIVSFDNLVVTIAAGNSGPTNEYFYSPACNYNAITVANVDDRGTATRDDDYITSSSTRGPTKDGRRKPDLAAPGRYIRSCNNNWETQADFINKTGTSMAAPMVLGVAMDLMDAGVTNELEIKALLINTAQKNNDSMNFDSDLDGWSTAYGWGYMNALAAYYHRDDVRTCTVVERQVDSSPFSGWYKLFKGVMHDEGGVGDNEGRDRITMVWHRQADYNPDNYPATYYELSDLNLRLYRESDSAELDRDINTIDNVHQVRIAYGAPLTEVVVRAYAYDTDFPHGGSGETFALATEEDFVEVDFPVDFSATAWSPTIMVPGTEADFEFSLVNNSTLASHDNSFTLILPAGWSLVSGPAVFSVGSLAGAGGKSNRVTWRLRAPEAQTTDIIKVRHTHSSYGLDYPAFDYEMKVKVTYDTQPPSPNPMTWITEPYTTGPAAILMVAETAVDADGVEYQYRSGEQLFDWQTSRMLYETSLSANTEYGYQVRARDLSPNHNLTGWSEERRAYTEANLPGAPMFTNPTSGSLDISLEANANPFATQYCIQIYDESGAAYFLDATGGNNGSIPVWQTLIAWGTTTVTGLDAGKNYCSLAQARNGDGLETEMSAASCMATTAEFNPDSDNDGDVDGKDLAEFILHHYDILQLMDFAAAFGSLQ